jgi:ADP-ribose pyrophosphatase YjhB (NUDIX family)
MIIMSPSDVTVISRKSAGGVVLNHRGEILLVEQGGHTWSLPKGHIEDGEEPLFAAKREIFEEAGISELQFVKQLGKYKRFKIGLSGGDDTSEMKEIVMFLFLTTETLAKPHDPTIKNTSWYAKEDVVERLTHKRDKDFFKRILPELKR